MADSTVQTAIRLPPDLLETIDARSDLVGLSRNAWMVKALTWATEQPIRTVRVEERL